MIASDFPRDQRPYKRYGAALALWRSGKPEVLLSGPAGTGKAQPLDAILYTPGGVKRMGDIAVGDLVLTPDGETASVLQVHPQGEKDIFRVTFTGGDSVECCADHLWQVTHNSRACLEKLHHCADKYPGMRALIARKTRESITQTAMVTYEQKVLPLGWLEEKYVRFNTTDQCYEYPNGSIIAVGGLDKASKIMSSDGT